MSGPPPPFLMVSEPGSFAEYTITQRKPQIIADILDTNPYDSGVAAALRAFLDELRAGQVAPLQEQADDTDFWRSAWLPWQGKTWRELSWFFAETYFYRRVLEIVGYFQPGQGHLRDPFAYCKRRALEDGLQQLGQFCASFPAGLPVAEEFALRLHYSLWGNRFDLSNVQAIVEANRLRKQEPSENLLLIDHTARLWDLFSAGQIRRLDVIADNSGLELLSDMALMDMLLARDLVERMRVHLKPQPFFVSDAMPQDFAATVGALQAHPQPELRELGARLEQYQRAGRLAAHTHPFWTTCLFFSQFPPDLAQTLAEADLLLCKGDVNYRRLLEDRHWPPTTDLAAVTRFMPAPFVSLRTLKGELIVGLPEGLAESLDQRDPTWLINGKRGLIHLVYPGQ
jgi:uncharacterized protein with ATP-grasp and redox domains